MLTDVNHYLLESCLVFTYTVKIIKLLNELRCFCSMLLLKIELKQKLIN